jgi:hypothetical protein
MPDMSNPYRSLIRGELAAVADLCRDLSAAKDTPRAIIDGLKDKATARTDGEEHAYRSGYKLVLSIASLGWAVATKRRESSSG